MEVRTGPSRTFEHSTPCAFYCDGVTCTGRRIGGANRPSRTLAPSTLLCFLLWRSHMHDEKEKGVAKGPSRTFAHSFPCLGILACIAILAQSATQRGPNPTPHRALAFQYLNDMTVRNTARMQELFRHAVTKTIDPCQGAHQPFLPASTPSWHAP